MASTARSTANPLAMPPMSTLASALRRSAPSEWSWICCQPVSARAASISPWLGSRFCSSQRRHSSRIGRQVASNAPPVSVASACAMRNTDKVSPERWTTCPGGLALKRESSVIPTQVLIRASTPRSAASAASTARLPRCSSPTWTMALILVSVPMIEGICFSTQVRCGPRSQASQPRNERAQAKEHPSAIARRSLRHGYTCLSSGYARFSKLGAQEGGR